jgi:hypothetical protein
MGVHVPHIFASLGLCGYGSVCKTETGLCHGLETERE